MKKSFRILKKVVISMVIFAMALMPVFATMHTNIKAVAEEQSEIQNDQTYQVGAVMSINYEKIFALLDKSKKMDKTLLQKALESAKVSALSGVNGMTIAEAEAAINAELATATEDVKGFGIGLVELLGQYYYAVETTEEEIEEAEPQEYLNQTNVIETTMSGADLAFTVSEEAVELKKDESAEVKVKLANGVLVRPTLVMAEDQEVVSVNIKPGSSEVVINGVKAGETKVKIGFKGETEGIQTYEIVNVKVTEDEVKPEPTPKPEEEEPSKKQEQGMIFFVNPVSIKAGETMILKIEGGKGTGAVSFKVENLTGEAVINGDVLTAKKVGMINLIAIKDGDETYKPAMAMTSMMIEAVATSDAGGLNQIFAIKNETSNATVRPNITLTSMDNSQGKNVESMESDDIAVTAGEMSEPGNHVSPLAAGENVEDAEEAEVYDASWMVWLWFLIPIITLLVMIIMFARNRLR